MHGVILSGHTSESSVWSKLMSDSNDADSSMVVNLPNRSTFRYLIILRPTVHICGSFNSESHLILNPLVIYTFFNKDVDQLKFLMGGPTFDWC